MHEHQDTSPGGHRFNRWGLQSSNLFCRCLPSSASPSWLKPRKCRQAQLNGGGHSYSKADDPGNPDWRVIGGQDY